MPSRIYRRAAGLLGVAALLAGCGGGSDEPDLGAPFSYDESRPLELRTQETERRPDGLEVREISYAGPSSRVRAKLVLPRERARVPAVIYGHGALGNRDELLPEAAQLARHGAVALTLELSYSPARAKSLPATGLEAVRARADVEVEAVREIRRAVDLLRSLPSVDGERIGYVGWSAGARMGAVAAGIERRIHAFDLVAGGATPITEYVRRAPVEVQDELEPILSETDPLRYIGHAAPSALFFQNGSRDEIVPREALAGLARAGSMPKEIRWYEGGHVPSARMWADSRRWLSERLDFA